MSATATAPPAWWTIVAPELVEQYVALVRQTRTAQRYYRRTLNPAVRTELKDLEAEVDRLTGQLHDALVAARAAAAADDSAEAEGGAP